MLLQQLHQLSRRCCWGVFFVCLFLHVASTFCHTQNHKFWIGVVQYKDETVMYSSCFFFFFPIGIPPRCNALLSREVSATGADDIIRDEHVFSVQVLNTSPYKVYNRWFGPGARLHLGMARECFFFFFFFSESSIKKVDRYKFSHFRLSKPCPVMFI